VTDSALADQAASERPNRRALLGAGVIGAALALAGPRPASAASGLSDSDVAAASFAISLELTARDLYDASIAAGATDDLWRILREQHESYAQRLAGITGVRANQRNDAVYDEMAEAFDTSKPASVAFDLENVAAATHTELVGQVDDVDLAGAMASFVSMQSRHATVLASLAGNGDDFDALFLNPATALSPEA
jgi:Ferritin-like domain